MSTLSRADIETIDGLCEMELELELVEWLEAFYGPNGRRERIWEAQQEERQRCKYHRQGWCCGCGNCVPYCEDGLWVQLAVILRFFELDLFDPDKDDYETLRARLKIKVEGYPPEDEDCPF